MFYLNAKQYENTPLNNDAGIFQNQNLLLKTDTYELGYKMIKKSDYRTWKIKVGLGSNFNGVNYLRMKGTTFNYIPINDLLNVKLFSNFGVMRASRVFQNEMFSRNKGKWMKERSK